MNIFITGCTSGIGKETVLALAKENHQKLQVLVKGDAGVPYGKVVVAMNLLKEAGAEEVGLLTDPSESEGG